MHSIRTEGLSYTQRWLGPGFGKTQHAVNKLKSKHILMNRA